MLQQNGRAWLFTIRVHLCSFAAARKGYSAFQSPLSSWNSTLVAGLMVPALLAQPVTRTWATVSCSAVWATPGPVYMASFLIPPDMDQCGCLLSPDELMMAVAPSWAKLLASVALRTWSTLSTMHIRTPPLEPQAR